MQVLECCRRVFEIQSLRLVKLIFLLTNGTLFHVTSMHPINENLKLNLKPENLPFLHSSLQFQSHFSMP